MGKNPKMVICRNCGAAIGANGKKCPSCGAKNKKPFYKKWWFVLVVFFLVVGCVNTISRKREEKEERKNEYRWPDSELADMIPEPDSKYGRIGVDSESVFSIDIYEISKSQYENYVDACKERGFIIDYSRHDDYYSADNGTGHSLTLHYTDGEKTMGISLYAPREQENGSDAEGESAEAGGTNQGGSAEEHAQETNYGQEDSMETQSAEEEAESSKEDENRELLDGMRPEFKEAMDSYEAFYDEYCEIMKQISDGSTDAALWKKYADFMEQMQDVNEKFEAWDGDMNNDETKYYIEVQMRISQKLLEAGTE